MQTTQYLNVDLEIESHTDLSTLVQAFGEHVVILHNGMWHNHHRVVVEVSSTQMTADETLVEFCRLIKSFSDAAQKSWQHCFSRKFDLGFACGQTDTQFHTTLQADTLQQLSAIGASIAITIYPMVTE